MECSELNRPKIGRAKTLATLHIRFFVTTEPIANYLACRNCPNWTRGAQSYGHAIRLCENFRMLNWQVADATATHPDAVFQGLWTLNHLAQALELYTTSLRGLNSTTNFHIDRNAHGIASFDNTISYLQPEVLTVSMTILAIPATKSTLIECPIYLNIILTNSS